MIGTACFYILPVVGDRTFLKDQELFKNVLDLFYPCRKFHRKPHFVETLLMHTSYDRKA